MRRSSTRYAVVLGGGGPHGRAWEIGLLKGLRDASVDLTTADLFVGTSAGSIVGAQIGSGRSLDDLYNAAVATPPGDPRLGTVGPPPDPQAFEEISRMWQGGADVTQERIVEIGRRALATKAVAEEVAIRDRVATLGITEWPSLPLKLAAVNTYDGAVRFFDRTQGVPIAWAIAASTAVPGWYEPITVGDGRYMDGGVRGLNVEGAAGYEILVVIAPGMSRTRRQEIERFGAQQDSRIVQVEPDEESRSVPGDIPASARAGLRLSTRVVNRVRSVWEASSAASP